MASLKSDWMKKSSHHHPKASLPSHIDHSSARSQTSTHHRHTDPGFTQRHYDAPGCSVIGKQRAKSFNDLDMSVGCTECPSCMSDGEALDETPISTGIVEHDKLCASVKAYPYHPSSVTSGTLPPKTTELLTSMESCRPHVEATESPSSNAGSLSLDNDKSHKDSIDWDQRHDACRPILPPRTHKDQIDVIPPLPPKKNFPRLFSMAVDDAPPLPPKKSREKISQRINPVSLSSISPPDPANSSMSPPPLPPRTYSPIHLTKCVRTRLSPADDNGPAGVRGAEGSVPSLSSLHSDIDDANKSVSVAWDVGRAAATSGCAWHAASAGQRPPCRRNAAGTEVCVGGSQRPLSGLNFPNTARDRNSLPAFTSGCSPKICQVDDADYLVPLPVSGHRVSASSGNSSPLSAGQSTVCNANACGLAEVAFVTPPLSDSPGIFGFAAVGNQHAHPKTQSSLDRLEQWQQVNHQLKLWTRRQIGQSDVSSLQREGKAVLAASSQHCPERDTERQHPCFGGNMNTRLPSTASVSASADYVPLVLGRQAMENNLLHTVPLSMHCTDGVVCCKPENGSDHAIHHNDLNVLPKVASYGPSPQVTSSHTSFLDTRDGKQPFCVCVAASIV